MEIDGKEWRLVPVEPTETMVVAGFESRPDKHFSPREQWEQYQAMTGCQQAAYRARLCWAAMLAVAPTPPAATAAPSLTTVRLLEGGLVQMDRSDYDTLLSSYGQAPAPRAEPTDEDILGTFGIYQRGLPNAEAKHVLAAVRQLLKRFGRAAPVAAQAPEHLLYRLRKHADDDRNSAFARSTMREALQYLEAAQAPAAAGDALTPDMYWNDADPEHYGGENLHDAVICAADDFTENDLPVELAFQCAKRLPNVHVMVNGYDDHDGWHYEVIDAAMQRTTAQEGSKQGGEHGDL